MDRARIPQPATRLPFCIPTTYPLHQGRKRGHPMVGQRAAGHRDNSTHDHEHIVGPTGFGALHFSELRVCWFRAHGPERHALFDPRLWQVSFTAGEHYSSFQATVDDFGSLVKVEPRQ